MNHKETDIIEKVKKNWSWTEGIKKLIFFENIFVGKIWQLPRRPGQLPIQIINSRQNVMTEKGTFATATELT